VLPPDSGALRRGVAHPRFSILPENRPTRAVCEALAPTLSALQATAHQDNDGRRAAIRLSRARSVDLAIPIGYACRVTKARSGDRDR